jgi:hypothetical protein
MASEQIAAHTGAASTPILPGPIGNPEAANQARSSGDGNEEELSIGAAKPFPQMLLNVGFCVALILSGACLAMGALYLNNFLNSTNAGVQSLIEKAGNLPPESLYTAINARLVMARIALLSCGVFIGMSFGFLGFALFLMGIKEEMGVTARHESFHVKLARLSPGVFVILCSTILIGVCISYDIPFSSTYRASQTRPDDNARRQNSDGLDDVDTSQPQK